MPIYEYRCAECGERFELFVRSAAGQTAPTCPRCGSPKVQKAISLFGVSGTGGGSKASAASCVAGPPCGGNPQEGGGPRQGGEKSFLRFIRAGRPPEARTADRGPGGG